MLCKIIHHVAAAEKSTYITINTATMKAKKLPYLTIISTLTARLEDIERNQLIRTNGWFNTRGRN